MGLTRCPYRQGKFQDTAALLDTLIEKYPDKVDSWLLQAPTYLGMKLPLKAAENLEALELLGKSTADSLHTLGDIYRSENLMDLASRAYIRAVEVEPAQSPSRAVAAAEALAGRGSLAQAQSIAARIREVLEPGMGDIDRRKLLKLESRIKMAEGEGGDDVVAVLEEVVQLDPLDGEALMLLGQHFSRSGEPDRAMFYYERAASIESVAGVAKIRHAQVLVGIGRYADAIPLLREAQDIKPRDDVARYLDQVERLSKAKPKAER